MVENSMDVIPNEIFKHEIIPNFKFHEIQYLGRTCKKFYEPVQKYIINEFEKDIDKNYKEMFNKFVKEGTEIGIKNLFVKLYYGLQRLNNYIRKTTFDYAPDGGPPIVGPVIPGQGSKERLLNKYLNIPRTEKISINKKYTIIQRTPTMLVKSIYLLFGFDFYPNGYYFIAQDQDKLNKLLRGRTYYI